jgi:hypothetical protein
MTAVARYPDSTKTSLEQRLRARARERWPQIATLQIRHRGAFSYVDATLADATTLKLCRLRYVGSAHDWQFAIYRASHDDYDESVFFTGLPVGTCQDALDTACGLYLNDPTAWTRPPTNLRARPLSQIHPHFREVMQLLATQAADEARHVEVFSRRGQLSGGPLGTSSAGGRASLQTLLNEPDFTTASFLLSVLGEGTFVDLLRFLHRHAPDPVTADVTRLALRDEARHVAFGVAHTAHAARANRGYLGALRQAVERRHAALLDTAGLNNEVFDALVLLAAGSWEPGAVSRGWQAVQRLQQTMDEGRRRRLVYIGFPVDEATELSTLHTRNFM